MITDDERRKRQRAYEIAKQNSKDRGVELTPETEELSKRFINGEISDEAFLLEVWKLLGASGKLH